MKAKPRFFKIFSFKRILLYVFCILFISLHSCRVFQFRESDKEIQATMKTLGYHGDIYHYKLNNHKIRFMVTGNPHGEALMLLHGSPSSLSGWRALFTDSTFMNTYKLIVIDRPGYGYSDFGNVETDIQVQSDIVEKIIDTLQLDSLNLLGSSYGGPVVAQVCMDKPDKIKHLIFVSSSVKPKAEKTYWISHPMTTPIIKYIFPAIFRMSSVEKLGHAKELEKIKDWEKIKCRTSVVHGDKDDLIYFSNAEYLKEKIPQSRLFVMKDKGHAVIFTDQGYFRDFLGNVLKD